MSDYKFQAKRPYWIDYGTYDVLFYDASGGSIILSVSKDIISMEGYEGPAACPVSHNSQVCFLEAFARACHRQHEMTQS